MKLDTPTNRVLIQSPQAFDRFGPKPLIDTSKHPADSPMHYLAQQAAQAQTEAVETYLAMQDRIKRTDFSRLVDSAQLNVRHNIGREFLERLGKVAMSPRIEAIRTAVVARQEQILAVTADAGEPTTRQLEIAKMVADIGGAKQMLAIDKAVEQGDAETIVSIVRAPSFLGFDPKTKARLRIEFGRKRLPDVAKELDELSEAEATVWSAVKSAEAAIYALSQLPTNDSAIRINVSLTGTADGLVAMIDRQNREAAARQYDPSLRPREPSTFAQASA